MNRLADLILMDMEKRQCSATYFADACGVSKNEIGNITRRKKKDMNISTLLKICENSGISVEDVFGIECSEEFVMENFVLTNGHEKYALKKL